ncbi:Na(+), Li(+), K(+)/H(+) antiporter [Rubrobacter xylanophilus DSM 9941]|nr:Na(+), Li(+), K(+)/H(+) antiporter [Rubrobacter xylanophilus DSM 9941]
MWLLVGAMLVFRFGQGLFYPFSTIYFHNFVGIPLSLIGAGLGLLAAASVFSGLISGPLADRYGRRPVMLAALSGSAASFALFAAAGGLPGYLLACLVAGLAGSSMFDASRNAMVADVTPPGLRARAYGLVRVGGNVGWALGPAVAGLVAASAGSSAGTYRLMFAGTAALTLLVALSLALLATESRPAFAAPGGELPFTGLRAALADGRFAALLAAAFLLYYVFTQDWQALPVYARNFLGIEEGRIGLFLAGNGLVVILLQMPVARLLDARSKTAALLACSLLFAASSATLLLTESFLGILLAFAGFFTLAEMILEVAGAALAAEMAPDGQRGTYLALFGVCFGAAQGLSPVVAGALLDARMPDAVWVLQLLAAGLAAGALVILRRKVREP